MPEDEDIREVMEEEKGRGRKQPHEIVLRRRPQKLLRELRPVLAEMNEKRFREAMLAYGLGEGSEEFETALRIWREGQKT